MDLQVAIIGCGNLGRTHAQCLSQLKGVTISVYCDVFLENAQKLANEFGDAKVTTNVEDVFSDPSVDVVYVTTLHDTHADYSIRALDAGKHVLVEKPLAMTVEDCIKIGDAVNRSGKKLMTAFKMRYYELLLKAKELIPNPNMITMQMMDDRWGDDHWANDPIKGGGNVLSQGCHSADILRFVAGKDPIEVYAVGGNYYQKTGVIDNLAAVYRFEGGAAGNLIQGDSGCPSFTSKFFMQIFAEGKSITLSERLTTLTYEEAGKEPQVFKGTESGFMEENRAFIACLLNDQPVPIDYIDGLYANLMILQAFESLKSGRPEPIRKLVQR